MNQAEPKAPISPVLQFVLLIVPIVMSGFYLVFTLAGIGLEDQDQLKWQLEARSVGFMVGGGICLYSLLVLALARFKKLKAGHLLNISAWGHLLLSVILTIGIFVMLL